MSPLSGAGEPANCPLFEYSFRWRFVQPFFEAATHFDMLGVAAIGAVSKLNGE
jgi:hypothetical protein